MLLFYKEHGVPCRVEPDELLEFIRRGWFKPEGKRYKKLVDGTLDYPREFTSEYLIVPEYSLATNFVIEDDDILLTGDANILALYFRARDKKDREKLFAAIKSIPFTYAAYRDTFTHEVVVWVKANPAISKYELYAVHGQLGSLYYRLTDYEASGLGSSFRDTIDVSFDPNLYINPDSLPTSEIPEIVKQGLVNHQ
jgi:hypothetical protein